MAAKKHGSERHRNLSSRGVPHAATQVTPETTSRTNQNPKTDEEATTKPTTSTGNGGIRGVAFIVLIASLIAGVLVGRARSPDYDKPGEDAENIRSYVTRFSKIDFPEWRITRSADGKIATVELQDGIIDFRCGFKSYNRRLQTGETITDAAYVALQQKQMPKHFGSPPNNSVLKSTPDTSNLDTSNIVSTALAQMLTHTPNHSGSAPPNTVLNSTINAENTSSATHLIDNSYSQAHLSNKLANELGIARAEWARAEWEDSLAEHASDLPAEEIQRSIFIRRQGASVNDIIAVMLGGAEVYTAKNAATQVGNYWREIYKSSLLRRASHTLQLFATGISGYAIGFYIGFDDAPDCSTDAFRNQLKQVELWKRVGLTISNEYSFQFTRDGVSGNIININTRSSGDIPLRTAWILVNSVVNSPDKEGSRADFIIDNSVRESLLANTESKDPLQYLPGWAMCADLVLSLLSESYGNSEGYLQLLRTAAEHGLWIRHDKKSWIADKEVMLSELPELWSTSRPEVAKAAAHSRYLQKH